MKNFNRRAISVALLLTLGAMFSVNASAAETVSIENSISEMVIVQGQQVVNELKVQLQQSITEGIASFNVKFSFNESMTESLAWLSEEIATEKMDEVKESTYSKVN